MSSEIDVSIQDIVKRFGAMTAVDHVSLDIHRGQFVTLLGPSGCGKTTTLRMIGGFEHPDEGEIAIRGVPMGNRPPHHRDTSMVFQNYALFPHMSVADNIAFGLKERKKPRAEIQQRVQEMLRLVELPQHGSRRPKQLSGGQQQRVALARSLVVEPTVLLLDEPLGALDLKLRRQMQLELKRIQERVGITFIYVTHDQEEALTMSDRIVVMSAGKIEQEGSAEEIFERPRTRFVADFMGAQNIFDADVVDADISSAKLRFGGATLAVPEAGLRPGETVGVMIRPEKIRLAADGAGMPATVSERVYKGSTMSYQLALADGTRLIADSMHDDHTERFAPGDTVNVAMQPRDLVVLRATQAPA